MPIDKKQMLKGALDMALKVARATNTPYDDFIVQAAVSILYRVFKLGEVK